MPKSTNAMGTIMQNIKMQIHTNAVASVVTYYEDTQEADIQPLFMMCSHGGELTKLAMINRVPVAGMRYKINHIIPSIITGLVGVHGGVDGGGAAIEIPGEIEFTPSLHPGDIVVVAFAERAMDNLTTEPFDPDSTRTHHIQDAMITGILFGAN